MGRWSREARTYLARLKGKDQDEKLPRLDSGADEITGYAALPSGRPDDEEKKQGT